MSLPGGILQVDPNSGTSQDGFRLNPALQAYFNRHDIDLGQKSQVYIMFQICVCDKLERHWMNDGTAGCTMEPSEA